MPKPEFALGSIVYLKADTEIKGIVSGFIIRDIGLSYLVVWTDDLDEREVWGGLLTVEKDYAPNFDQ